MVRQGQIVCDGMARMLLADVRDDGDMLGAQSLAFSQQFGGIGIHESLVGDMGMDECLCSDEIELAAVRDGQCGLIGAREHLYAHGAFHGAANHGRDSCHGRYDLGSDLSVQIGQIVHVLDENGIESCIGEQHRFMKRDSFDLIDRQLMAWRSR